VRPLKTTNKTSETKKTKEQSNKPSIACDIIISTKLTKKVDDTTMQDATINTTSRAKLAIRKPFILAQPESPPAWETKAAQNETSIVSLAESISSVTCCGLYTNVANKAKASRIANNQIQTATCFHVALCVFFRVPTAQAIKNKRTKQTKKKKKKKKKKNSVRRVQKPSNLFLTTVNKPEILYALECTE
jgi:hypothetical protein